MNERFLSIDFQRATMNLSKAMKVSNATIATKLNIGYPTYRRLASGEYNNPPILVAVKLMMAHKANCPELHASIFNKEHSKCLNSLQP